MTRFARAKGSKSSNEKAPEDSTPWEVMKDQLLQAKKEGEESKKRQEAENQRIENYENFLKEHKKQKRKSEWCDFPEDEEKVTSKSVKNEETSSKSKKKKKLNKSQVKGDSNNLLQVNSDHHQENVPNPVKQKQGSHTAIGDKTFQEQSITVEDEKPKKKNKNKHQQKNENKPQVEGSALNGEDISRKKNKQKTLFNDEEEAVNTGNELGADKNIHKTPRSKKNKNKHVSVTDVTDQDNENNTNMGMYPAEEDKSVVNKRNKIKALKKKKDKKLVDGVPARRKEIDHSFQLIINGKEVELVRYDGFPIMKKDAVRLEEMKNSMIKKGIPKSEVQRNMKLERRRAEKALARLKRDVCYNCRKGGHNLSDCPDLKSKIPGVDGADGVCFKCGSTEHRQIDCKVQRDKEFRFATCFICKEPGHLARQCPDNPKGLYPNGGGCKLCGDVTHLRKDCPTVNDKKEESTVKLQTLATSDNIEDVPIKTLPVPEPSKKPKKIMFL